MAILQQTVVDQIEITRNSTIQIRFGLLVEKDGEEIACAWQRTAIEPGGDVDAQIAAVNANLVSMKREPCPISETARLKAIQAIVQTPAVIAAYKASHAA